MKFSYGCVWLAMVCLSWFTRERSKVRSLVRPPCFALRAAHGAASQIREDERRLSRRSRKAKADENDSDRKHPDRDDGAERGQAGDGPAGRVGGVVLGACMRHLGSHHRVAPV